jgi:ABC-type transport system involved in cytochrome bd biosynthesis fused ATPase/permease subunit
VDQKKILVISAGAIGAAAVAVFFILMQGAGFAALSPTNTLNPNNNTASASNSMQDLALSVKYVNITQQNEIDAKVLVAFQVGNPNPSTAILENVHYTLSVGKYQMTSGDTGEVLEGFLGSQATAIPIVPKGTVLIKDEQVARKNNLTASSWDTMVAGKAKYDIEGWYAVRTTSDLQTSYQEKNFSIKYPPSG